MASHPGVADPGDERDVGVVFPRFATVVLLLLALVLRQELGYWQLNGGFRGHQTCFFLVSAVQYERLGAAKTLGYPMPTIDGVPIGDDDVAPLADDPATIVYVNHPPTVPLFAWSALQMLGRDRWQAWSEFLRGISTDDVDVFRVLDKLQAPFLALHLFGLWAFAWCVRQAFGRRAGLFALAILAVTPIAIRLGAGVGYENPSLPFVFLALGFWVRYARAGARRELALACAALAVGTSMTWGPLFLVPAIALESALQRRWTLVRQALLALGPAALLPLLGHLVLAHATGAGSGGALSHALDLMQPLVHEPGRWLATQGAHAFEQIGAPVLIAALGGLVLVASRGARSLYGRCPATDAPVCVPFVLLGAATLQLAGFARHALEDQPIFQLVLAPATAALGGLLLDAIAGHRSFLRTAAATGLFALGIAPPSIAKARAQTNEDGLRGIHEYIGTLPVSPLAFAQQVREATPPGSLVLIPEGWRGMTSPMSVAAWRHVFAVRSIAEADALRKRYPALRRRPTYAVTIWASQLEAGFDVERANQEFLSGLPPGALRCEGAFRTQAWRLP